MSALRVGRPERIVADPQHIAAQSTAEAGTVPVASVGGTAHRSVPEVPEGTVRYLSTEGQLRTVEHPDTVEPHRTEAPVRTAGSWVRGAPGIRVVAAPVDTLAAEEPRTAVVETGSRAEPAPVAVHTPVEWAAVAEARDQVRSRAARRSGALARSLRFRPTQRLTRATLALTLTRASETAPPCQLPGVARPRAQFRRLRL